MARSRGLSRATGSADTNGVAIAIPSGANSAKISVNAEAYGGRGTSSSVPAPTASNTVYLDGAELWTFDERNNRAVDTHLYIYAVAVPVDYFISFYG